MVKRLPLFLIFVFPPVVCLLAWYVWYSPATTVVLVHLPQQTGATSMSEKDAQRAGQLAYVLHAIPLKRFYVPEEYKNARASVTLGSLLELVPTPMPHSGIRARVDSVMAHRGDAILIAEDAHAIPLIMQKLGVASSPAFDAAGFNDLYVVTVFRFRSTVVHLKY